MRVTNLVASFLGIRMLDEFRRSRFRHRGSYMELMVATRYPLVISP